jgi:hypothetical protein
MQDAGRGVSRWGWVAAGLGAVVLAAAGCGFGLYDDSSAPQVTSANDGVADAGQWWPFVCPDGDHPSPASAAFDYTASGTCGPGGPFTLSVDGCEMFGDWPALGLSDVQTTQSTSTPNLGGWILTAAAPPDGGVDGGDSWNCAANLAADGGLAFSCSDAVTSATTCQSTLTPAGGS